MEHCSRGQGFFGKSSFPTTNSLVYVSVLRGGYKHYNNWKHYTLIFILPQ